MVISPFKWIPVLSCQEMLYMRTVWKCPIEPSLEFFLLGAVSVTVSWKLHSFHPFTLQLIQTGSISSVERGRARTETTCWWQEVGPPRIQAADWISILGRPCSHLLVPWESGAQWPTGEAPALPGLCSDVCYVWHHLWMTAKWCIMGFADWLYQSLVHYCREPRCDLRRWKVEKEQVKTEFKNICCVFEKLFSKKLSSNLSFFPTPASVCGGFAWVSDSKK